jgi:hypothetical protein
MKTLSAAEARRTYDRIGKMQDTQAFYEDRATAELIANLDLPSARSPADLERTREPRSIRTRSQQCASCISANCYLLNLA